jgi:hypothetical protein
VDELSNLSIEMETKGIIQRELCAYGGHLNRYTFLKVSFKRFTNSSNILHLTHAFQEC